MLASKAKSRHHLDRNKKSHEVLMLSLEEEHVPCEITALIPPIVNASHDFLNDFLGREIVVDRH